MPDAAAPPPKRTKRRVFLKVAGTAGLVTAVGYTGYLLTPDEIAFRIQKRMMDGVGLPFEEPRDRPPRGFDPSSDNTTQLDNTSGGDDVADLNGRFIGWVADESSNTERDGEYFVQMGVGRLEPGRTDRASIRIIAFVEKLESGPKKVAIKVSGMPQVIGKTPVSMKTTHNGVEGYLVAFQTSAIPVEDGDVISAKVSLGGIKCETPSYTYEAQDFVGKDPGFDLSGLQLSTPSR